MWIVGAQWSGRRGETDSRRRRRRRLQVGLLARKRVWIPQLYQETLETFSEIELFVFLSLCTEFGTRFGETTYKETSSSSYSCVNGPMFNGARSQ